MLSSPPAGTAGAAASALALTVFGDALTSAPALAAVGLRLRGWKGPVGREDGSMLVEVMVGALVLAIATLAVLSGLDGAQDTGRRNKVRSVSAALAQQDVERLRSLPITSLSNLRQTRQVNVKGVPYTVSSRTDWVRDASGVVSCTDDSSQAEYMKVTSTVRAAPDDPPVEETTLLTPRPGAFSTDSGTAAVLLTDRDGHPLSGVSVSLSGPGSYSDMTNDLGCAIFGYIPVGDYTATITAGLVSWSSVAPATAQVTVNAGRTSLAAIELDRPASLRAVFREPDGDAAQWNSISVAHSKLPGGFKLFPDPASPTTRTSIDADNLFPHYEAYGVYAGDCEANNPAFWNPSYFQEGVPGHVQLEPGDLLRSVPVTMPTLRVTVGSLNSSGNPVSFARAHVVIYQTDRPSSEIDCRVKVAGPVRAEGNATSYVFDFALPFGHYRMCADNNARRRWTTTDRNLTTPVQDMLTLNVRTSDSPGLCS